VVRSPRQTVSLLGNRRRHRDPFPRSPSFAAGDHGPKPAEVYGFVGSITTALYLAWFYTPEPCLRSVGITYYPSKYSTASSLLTLLFVACWVQMRPLCFLNRSGYSAF
jgi:phosphatidylinositol N-acetylglucosaminyltransferase subunit P